LQGGEEDATCTIKDGLELFLSVLSATMQEEVIKRSPKGHMVANLLCHVQCLDNKRVEGIADYIISRLNTCLLAGKRHKLPSVAQGAVWSAFHKLRLEQDIQHAWKSFVTTDLPSSSHNECELTFQILLDRLLKKIISDKANLIKKPTISSARPLTYVESNGIRYMAGYVAVKLLKKYNRRSKRKDVDHKYKLFVKVLNQMKAINQMGEPDSPLEYSTMWLEVIDRGGLYHINDDVFHLIESIEMVVREHFNFKSVEMYVPQTDLSKQVHDQVFATHDVVTCWEKVAGYIPPKYEKYSVELLSEIVDLWITIRGHSFVKGWNIKFERKYKQGTRKTLAKPKEQ
jgi:hypothetical protein